MCRLRAHVWAWCIMHAVMLKLVCLWVDIFNVAFPNGPGDDEGSAPPGSYERDCWEA